MSEAPAQPIVDAYQRGGAPDLARGAFPAAAALVVAGGAVVLALVASHAAEPLMLTVMAALATVGVFFLFALAARHVRFAQHGTDPAFVRAIFNAVDDPILVTDAVGRVRAGNTAFRAFAGTNNLGELNSLDHVLASELGGTDALFRLTRSAERAQASTEELMLNHRPETQADAGARRWFRISVKPFQSAHLPHAPALTLWRMTDVTAEREKQSEALETVRAELQQYASLPLGIASVRPTGQITYISERLAGWLGYAPTDPAGGTTTNASAHDHRPRELQLSDVVADGGAALLATLTARADGSPHRLELDLVADDGRRWPAIVLAVPSDGTLTLGILERSGLERSGEAGSGAPGAATGAAVTGASAKASRGGEQRYSRYLQSAPFGIASIDCDGTIVSANPAFSRLLLDGAAQAGANLADVLGSADSSAREVVARAIEAARHAKAQIAPFDIVLGGASASASGQHAAGSQAGWGKGRELARKISIVSLARAGVAPPVAGQEAAVVYVHDVTEAKALEHKVAQAQKMQAVGTLAGGIAHDFNNVLTAIIGFSDLLLQTHRPGNPSYAHILSVKSSANRAAGLVRQLLAFSRRQTLQPKVLQLGDVLTDWSMLFNRLLGEKIELKISTGRDLWFVKADPTELERTIINLAVNARDAMLPKGGRLAIRTRNVSERESQKLEAHGVIRGEYVAIEVEDTGTGMPPDVLAKIFDPFFTTKAVGKGTGLGLASVTGFVQQTGGYIIPESTVGEGTTFRIYLPRYHPETDEEIEPVAAAKKLRSGDLTGSGRVLLVEDEDAVRRFAVAALKSKGYEVLEAGNGVEALEVLAAHGNEVDLVVSDVIMPEMDGPTLLKELRKTQPKTRFIFVSGYPDDAFKTSLDPDTEFTFLPKPYSLAQLAAKVKEQIAR